MHRMHHHVQLTAYSSCSHPSFPIRKLPCLYEVRSIIASSPNTVTLFNRHVGRTILIAPDPQVIHCPSNLLAELCLPLDRKTEHIGYVETPRARRPYSRRKSQFPDDEADDSSSATDNSIKVASKKTPKRSVSMLEKAVNGHTSNDAATNGHARNGVATNGHTPNATATSGHTYGTIANGHANGTFINGAAKKADPKPSKVVDGWEEGKDPKIDYSGHFDFGGSFGVTAMMIGFPLLMYYMWIGATFYDGKFPRPASGESFLDFAKFMGKLVYDNAFPSLYAWGLYWGFLIVQGAFYCLLPGVWSYGKPLAHEGGKQLKYYCSGVWSFYTTIVIMATLHVTGIFPLYIILDQFGPILSVAIISGFVVSIVAYISALARGAQHRMTGYPLYDFFMGAELNPRMFGILDFKMFFEVRLPWFILFGLSSATAARQYDQLGYVTAEVWFLVMAHFLYANACCKGEELITPTWYAFRYLFYIFHILTSLQGYVLREMGLHAHLLEPCWCTTQLLSLYTLPRQPPR
jgi:Delta24(24(1))-sterol reductase